MLNLHDDPDITLDEAEFARFLASSIEPIQLSRTQSFEPSINATNDQRRVPVPAVRHPEAVMRRTRLRITAALVSAAAMLAGVMFMLRAEGPPQLTAVYTAPKVQPMRTKYLPVNLPKGMKIGKFESLQGNGVGSSVLYVARRQNGSTTNFVQLIVDPAPTRPPLMDRRVQVDGKWFGMGPQADGITSVWTQLDDCGVLHAFGAGYTVESLARLTAMVQCESGSPIAVQYQDFTLLYQQLTETPQGTNITVSTEAGDSIFVTVVKTPFLPAELLALMWRQSAEDTEPVPSLEGKTVKLKNGLGILKRNIDPTTGKLESVNLNIISSPDLFETTVIIEARTEADAIVVAQSIEEVDEQTWEATLKQNGVTP